MVIAKLFLFDLLTELIQTSSYNAQETALKHEKDIHRCEVVLRDSMTSSLNSKVHQYVTKCNLLKLDIYTFTSYFQGSPRYIYSVPSPSIFF